MVEGTLEGKVLRAQGNHNTALSIGCRRDLHGVCRQSCGPTSDPATLSKSFIRVVFLWSSVLQVRRGLRAPSQPFFSVSALRR